ncbi:hypothetical protein G9P44_004155 [Scheffersomyces stipitis]|nr:hypothetical protein G9P44_004155 [Scheffersomyces stipitis]
MSENMAPKTSVVLSGATSPKINGDNIISAGSSTPPQANTTINKESPLTDIATSPPPFDLALPDNDDDENESSKKSNDIFAKNGHSQTSKNNSNSNNKDSYESSELSDLDDDSEAETDKMDFLEEDDAETSSAEKVSDLETLSKLTELARLKEVDSDFDDDDENESMAEDLKNGEIKQELLLDSFTQDEPQEPEDESLEQQPEESPEPSKTEEDGDDEEEDDDDVEEEGEVKVEVKEIEQADEAENAEGNGKRKSESAEVEDDQEVPKRLKVEASPAEDSLEDHEEDVIEGPQQSVQQSEEADESVPQEETIIEEPVEEPETHDEDDEDENKKEEETEDQQGDTNKEEQKDFKEEEHEEEETTKITIEITKSEHEESHKEDDIEDSEEKFSEERESDTKAEDDDEEGENKENGEEDDEEVGNTKDDIEGEFEDVDLNEQRKLAIEELISIESAFAELRDKLYQDKLNLLEHELQLCLEGSHPELSKIYYKVNSFYQDHLKLANSNLAYKLKCIDKETIATRTSIHQDFLKNLMEAKNSMITSTTSLWYKINKERNQIDQLVPDYNFSATPMIPNVTVGPVDDSAVINGGFSYTNLGTNGSVDYVEVDTAPLTKKAMKQNMLIELVQQRNSINSQLGVLNGLIEFHGFPSAIISSLSESDETVGEELLLKKATEEEVNEDLKAMGISI